MIRSPFICCVGHSLTDYASGKSDLSEPMSSLVNALVPKPICLGVRFSEAFLNLDRPHGAFKGKTPYEALRCMLE